MSGHSTLEDVSRDSADATARWIRRVAVALLLILVVAGAFGVFGVHSRTIDAEGEGYTMTLTYPQSARAGLDVPWHLVVHHAGGLPDELTVAVTADYWRMFETQGWFPEPDSVTADATDLYLTFTTAKGSDEFAVDYDAYIQPSSQVGKSATVRLIIDKHTVATASLHSWLVP